MLLALRPTPRRDAIARRNSGQAEGWSAPRAIPETARSWSRPTALPRNVWAVTLMSFLADVSSEMHFTFLPCS
ncbi:MAG: hypothetical protein JO252_08695 [Planctomycetaceae bacterium]|nr:hypothetical protein [Planctomycetaceae bacterium]